jgi:multiple sugar transport system permease protein
VEWNYALVLDLKHVLRGVNFVGTGLVIKKQKNLGYKFSRGTKEWMEASVFIGIGLVLFIVFVLYPQINNIYISLTKYNIMPHQPSEFIGLDNFKMIFLSGDDSTKYWLAFRNTLLYGAVTVPFQIFLGLIVAVLINSLAKGKVFYKVMLYIPVITSWLVVSILFKYLFQDGNGGLINYGLMNLHLIKEPISWLQNTWTANAVIWILGIWKGIGWVMIIYIAALQGISKDLYEAAEIDGADSVRKFWRITVPLIKPTTFYILINLIIGAFGVFIQVMMITNGGPLGTTDVLNNYMYTQAFQYFDFGYAAAIGIVSGVLILAITLIQRKIFRFDENQY